MEVMNLNPLLTPTVKTSHIYPHLQLGSLISIGQLCDDGCTTAFTATNLNIVKYGLTVLEGNQSKIRHAAG